jgi:hypothetical protein
VVVLEQSEQFVNRVRGELFMPWGVREAIYTASGGTEVTFSGTIGDLGAPFTLVGVGQGFDVQFGATTNAITLTRTRERGCP